MHENNVGINASLAKVCTLKVINSIILRILDNFVIEVFTTDIPYNSLYIKIKDKFKKNASNYAIVLSVSIVDVSDSVCIRQNQTMSCIPADKST